MPAQQAPPEQQTPPARLTRFDQSSIDPQNPWEGNHVPERELVAKTLTKHFTACGGPYVLSISSAWGTGKSDFLERWDYWLQQPPEPKLCFRFNAWEHDFADDPFLAFALALNSFIDSKPPKGWAGVKPKAKKVVNSLIKTAGKVVFPVAKKIAAPVVAAAALSQGTDPQTATITGKVAEAGVEMADEVTKDLLEKLESLGQSRAEVTQSLEKFGQAVLKKTTTPLIIMVDELDRCKPSFAVALLEAIKHLFCVPGVVFVLALESKQLANCIGKTYGLDEAGAHAYLHKFVDMDILLPQMDMYTFLRTTLGKHNFSLGLPDDLSYGMQQTGPIGAKLSEWIAAIIHDILSSPREALQVMNQISVLSFRPDMEVSSLLACAYALAHRSGAHGSSEEAITAAMGVTELVARPLSEKNFYTSYRNLFSGLMQSRSVAADSLPFDVDVLFTGDKLEDSSFQYLCEPLRDWLGYSSPEFLCNIKRGVDQNSSAALQWRRGQGLKWKRQLINYLSFVEAPETPGTPWRASNTKVI